GTGIAPELLDDPARNKTPPQHVLVKQLGNPLRILDVTFAAGQLLDQEGVDKNQLKTHPRKDIPHRNPVNTGALHRYTLYSFGFQVPTQRADTGAESLKDLNLGITFAIEYGTKNTIFVHV